MIYPNFLKNKDIIGITAPSNSISDNIELYSLAKNNLKKHFKIIETKSIYSNKNPSNTKEERAKEFNSLLKNNDINMILSLRGGDYLIDMLPLINYRLLLKNPKWIVGYSDPTSILYTITTKYDIATIYGVNATSFSQQRLHKSLKDAILIFKGNLINQESFKKYEGIKNDLPKYILTDKVNMNFYNIKNDTYTGRCLGGCIDVIKDIIKTPFDGTDKFIKKYKDDKIIWYFDVFSLSSEELFRTLWQMKELNYFKYTSLIIFGRICIESSFTSTPYDTLIKEILEDIPFITDADIGHIKPSFTLINGSLMTVNINKDKINISFSLK